MASRDALEKLKDAMRDSGKSVEDLFNEIDTDGDGTINGPNCTKASRILLEKRLLRTRFR